MSVDITKETTFTDYDWSDSTRPVLVLDDTLCCCLTVGGHTVMDLSPTCGDTDIRLQELQISLECYRELFAQAEQHVVSLLKEFNDEE